MTDLPAPFVPADCDLQDFPFMPLQVARLRDSDLAAEEDPEACWYAVLLWAASWHQLPAGSLPDNDSVLMRFVGLGRDRATWDRHRAGALRGFVKCSDGRLYHPVIAEQVNNAWSEKQAYRDRKGKRSEIARKAAAARWAPEQQCVDQTYAYAPGMHNASEPDASCMPDAMPKGTGTGKGKDKREAIASLSSADDEPALDLRDETIPPPSRRMRTYPAEFEAAWKAYPHFEGRSSKPKALENWRRLPTDERNTLVTAIDRFKPHVERVCGGKGAPDMARWLRDGKHLGWLEPSTPDGLAVPICRFAGPAALRASVVEATDEGFAVKYIDPAGWREHDRTIVARNAMAAGQIHRELRDWLTRTGVKLEVYGEHVHRDREAATAAGLS